MNDNWDDDGWRDAARQYHQEERRDELTGRSAERAEAVDGNTEIERLSKLPKLEYYRVRKEVSERLGVGAGELDRLVGDARKSDAVKQDDPQHWDVDPAGEAVDGVQLLDSIKSMFERYLVLPPHASEATTLWVMHTWTIDACDISPYLALISPERRCGKTTLLKLLYRLTRRAVLASNITPAALFRYIEAKSPTLLIDEFDAALKDNEQLRGVLDSGHSREAAYSIRCDGENNEPKRFSTWAPKAIAAIGKIADTLMDRSIVVAMRRKKKSEKRPRYRGRDQEYQRLRRQALRWANDNVEALRDSEPNVPDALNDRAADNWRPLLAIADAVGAHWPKLARAAALPLSGDEATEDTEGVQLLIDIRAIFAQRRADRLTSVDLTGALAEIEGRPWGEWRGGKTLSPHGLARLLKPFRVIPTTIRIGDHTAKGYRQLDFEECFEVYLPQGGGCEPSQRNNADEISLTASSETVTPQAVLRSEKRGKPARNGHCDDVTVASPGGAPQGHLCVHCRRPGATEKCCTPENSQGVWLHVSCERPWLAAQAMPDIPEFLRRRPQ